MVADVISLIALGVIFQSNSPITILPLWIYFPLLIVSIGILFKIVPKVSDFIMQKELTGYKNYEEKLRFVVIMLIGILLYFSLLGVHPILAAFLAGLSLSKVVMKEKTKIVHTKLHTLGYGMFVPVFFFVVGMELDLGVLWNVNSMSLILPVLIVGLSKKASLVFGSISTTQLTTTLAVTYAAAALGLLDSLIVSSIIILALITTLWGLFLQKDLVQNQKKNFIQINFRFRPWRADFTSRLN